MGIKGRAALAAAGSLTVQQSGMDGAVELLTALGNLGSNVTGISLNAKERDENGSITNADVVNFLAGCDKDGEPADHSGPVRDIRPTDEDSDEAAQIFIDKVTRRFNMRKKRGGFKKKWSKAARAKFVARGKKMADDATMMGLRAAGRHIKKIMSERVQRGEYDKVTESYATARERKYGVPRSSVLKASGQLLRNLEGAQLKIHKKGGGLTFKGTGAAAASFLGI